MTYITYEIIIILGFLSIFALRSVLSLLSLFLEACLNFNQDFLLFHLSLSSVLIDGPVLVISSPLALNIIIS